MTSGKAMTAGEAMPGGPVVMRDKVVRVSGHDGPGSPTPRQPPDLSKLKRATTEQAGSRNELAWLLVLDNLVDSGTAESHWLDQVGTRLVRGGTRPHQTRTRTTTRSDNERSTRGANR